MTSETDILGRAPILVPMPEPAIEIDHNWRGEHFLRVPKNPHGGGNYAMKSNKVNTKRSILIARREKLAGLVGKGLTETDIAATLGTSRTCIRADLKAMGLKA